MTWRERAGALWKELNAALDGGTQLKLIADNLRDTYEEGVGDGIKMEGEMRKHHDSEAHKL